MAIIQRFSGVLGGGLPVDNRTGITKLPGKNTDTRQNKVNEEGGQDTFDRILEKYMNSGSSSKLGTDLN